MRTALTAERRKLATVTPGSRVRILECEEEAALCALSSAPMSRTLSPSAEDVAAGDLIGGVTGERVGERGLAGAVGAHDRVHLIRVHRQVDAADDLRAVRLRWRRTGL